MMLSNKDLCDVSIMKSENFDTVVLFTIWSKYAAPKDVVQ